VEGFTFMPQTGSRSRVGAEFGGFVDIQVFCSLRG
jgi:hypothetical protein